MRHRAAAVALILAGGVAAGLACAQGYPGRALRIVVPSSAGSGADLSARLIAQPLSERLGQQVVVENRAGAATLIGTEMVAKSPPDGYTLLLGVGTLATAPAIYRKMPYDAQRDFAAITQLASVANALVVHPSLPAKSVKELVALAKARPGEIAFASSGTGTLPQLSMELFLVMTGTKMLHVPYKGPGPGLLDLLAGRVSAMTTQSVRERFGREGMAVVAGTPQEFATYIRSETEKWAKIVKRAGIQPE
jgi:tripartite-type tricarboxylate transporter receptor subunit TctC